MHKIKIDLKIHMNGSWHSGSGWGNSVSDRTVLRDHCDKPFLPGSTLKGVVRESCEKLSKTLKLPEPEDLHSGNLKGKSPVEKLFGTSQKGGCLFFRDAASNDELLPIREYSRTSIQRGLGTVLEHNLFTTEASSVCTLETTIQGWHEDLWCPDKEYPPFEYALLMAGLYGVDRIGSCKSIGWGQCKLELLEMLYNEKSVSIQTLLEVFDFSEYYPGEV